MNEWKFSGEIVKLNELENSKNFRASVTIKGILQGKDIDSKSVELGCMIPKKVFNRKVKLYNNISVSGHFETWTHVTAGGNIKSSLSRIVDEIL